MSARFTAVSVCALACFAPLLHAQQALSEALNDFPLSTKFVEYENLAALRSLPEYTALRREYFAQPLQDLEDIFVQAGIAADDIEEIAIGSRSAHPAATATYGVLTGVFPVFAKGLIKARIEETLVRCLPTEKSGLCFLQLDGTAMAFGTFSHLYSLLHAKQGLLPALNSNRATAELLRSSNSVELIRGFGDSSGLREYLRTLLPASLAEMTDWSKLLADVQSFSYGFAIGRETKIRLELACQSENGAAGLRQVMSTLAAVQNSIGAAGPIHDMQVLGSGVKVGITTEAAVTALSPQ